MLEDNIVEPLDINNYNKGFVSNKLPDDIKNNYYKLINGGLQKKKNFISSKISDLQEVSILDIIICFFFSLSFYILLAAAILTGDKTAIIYLIIVYLLGTIIQIYIVPIPCLYYSKMEFDENMKRLFNSTVHISLKSKKDAIEYPIKYISDITGEINIPKDIEYVKIGRIQYYFEEDFLTFTKQYKSIIGNYTVSKKLSYKNEPIKMYQMRIQ